MAIGEGESFLRTGSHRQEGKKQAIHHPVFSLLRRPHPSHVIFGNPEPQLPLASSFVKRAGGPGLCESRQASRFCAIMGVNVAISAPPLLPLDLRLRSLESQILGVPPSISSPAPTIDVKKWSITRRLRDLQDGLERLTGDSEGLKRLLAGCTSYSSRLNDD